MKSKTTAIVQARLGSTRLPNKVLCQLGDSTILGMLLSRLKSSETLDEIVVAIPDNEGNNRLAEYLDQFPCLYSRGDERDVLSRFFTAAREHDCGTIVRVTSDCPFIDGALVDEVVRFFRDSQADYVSSRDVPHGFEVEVFTFEALARAHNEEHRPKAREHVTTFISEHSIMEGGRLFAARKFMPSQVYPEVRLTIDYEEDLIVARRLVDLLGEERPWHEYISHSSQEEEPNNSVQQQVRYEGYAHDLMEDSAKLAGYERSKYSVKEIVREYQRAATSRLEHEKVKWSSAEKMCYRFEEASKALSFQGHEQWLDVGSGTGALQAFLLKRYPEVRAVGLELVPELHAFSLERQDVKGCSFLVGDFLEFNGGPFDRISCIGVLQKTNFSLEDFFRHASFLSGDNALLYVETKNLNWKKFSDPNFQVTGEHEWFTLEELRSVAQVFGFILREAFGLDLQNNSRAALQDCHTMGVLFQRD